MLVIGYCSCFGAMFRSDSYDVNLSSNKVVGSLEGKLIHQQVCSANLETPKGP